MRVIACMIVISATALLAAPKPDATPSWADWAGGYQGSLSWSRCSVSGAKSASLSFDITDGVASIDLAPSRPGMPALSLIADDKGWSGRQGDLAVTVTRPKADTIDLAVDLDSGCTMRGRLVRATMGIAACNALVGWARIEARCTKLHDAPLEDVAKLVTTRWKPADTGRCAARAEKLERSLVDAGCAPHPDPLIGVRARDCLELSQASAKLARCGNLPQPIKDSVVQAAQALASASQSAEKATLPYVEQQCRDTRASLVAISTRFRCPL